MTTTQDHVIVDRLLERTRHLSQLEVEQRVAGVTQSDVSRWRRGDYQRLTAKKRRAIVRWLEKGELRPDALQAEREAMLNAARALRQQAEALERQAERLTA